MLHVAAPLQCSVSLWPYGPLKHERHTHPSRQVTSSPGILGICEQATPHVFPFTLIEAKLQSWSIETEVEERQLSAKIKIRSRENKPVITTFCYRLCAFILDEEIHKQRLPEKKKNKVTWSRRRPFLDRKWFPAVGLHGRNTRLTLHHPSLHGPLTCSNSSFPQLQ